MYNDYFPLKQKTKQSSNPNHTVVVIKFYWTKTNEFKNVCELLGKKTKQKAK